MLMVPFVLLSYAAVDTKRMRALYPQTATPGGSGSISIVGKLAATFTGAKGMTKLVTALLPATRAAKIVCTVVGIAGALAADYVFDAATEYFNKNGITRNEAGDLTQTKTVPVPSGYNHSDFQGEHAAGTSHGFNATSNDALTQCMAAEAADVAAGGFSQLLQCNQSTDLNHYPPLTVSAWRYGIMRAGVLKYHWFYYPPAGMPVENKPKTDPLSSAALEGQLKSALESGDQDAFKAAVAALEAAANALANTNSELAKNAAAMAAIQTQLTASVSQAQLDAMEAEAGVLPDLEGDVEGDMLTPAQITAAIVAALTAKGLSDQQIAAAVSAALAQAAGGGLTQAQTQAAVQAALAAQGVSSAEQLANTQAAVTAALAAQAAADNAEVNSVPPPVDPNILLPEKLSLTAVMQDFVTSINNLPMLNTLRGVTVNVSGTSQLCLNMPSNLGGNRCWDGGHMQGALNMIGTALLGMVSLVSFIGIFKG